ncbi:MAG: hypothetical protein G01um10143_699 [Parcubacteria group bacterium Gr01-1014_3]|nr:MAG: hypothetical protein G01um10143_699 [Parcubacteria group bacterium Gr01-1014_3]
MVRTQNIPPNSEHEEFGPGKKGYILCPEGKEVYFKKSWHPNLESLPELNAAHNWGEPRSGAEREEKSVKFELCPAHQMLKDKQYEGEVIVENLNEANREELTNLIKNRGEEAERRDTLHRILKIEQQPKGIRVETSENQLAQKIGKAIGSHYKKADLKIQPGSGTSDVGRVRIILP